MNSYAGSYLPIKLDHYNEMIGQIIKAHRLIVEYDTRINQTPVESNLIMVPFNLAEALYSTRIEGTKTTIESYYEETIDKINNVNNRELNNYLQTIEYCKDLLKDIPISSRLFKSVHASLLSGEVRGKDCTPGEFRRTQNWIGPDYDMKHATFIPPSPEKIAEYLSNLEKYINDDPKITDDYDELVKCAIIHAQFETIHPFLDGNGRVGRILIPAYLYVKKVTKNMNLYISPSLEAQKHKYYELLNETRKGIWDNWIKYFIECIINQTNKNIDKISEYEEVLKKGFLIINQKFSKDTLMVYTFFFRKPVCTLKEMEKMTGFSYDKVRREINKLEKEKLIYKDQNLRNSKYYCYDVLNIMKKL